MYNVVGVKVTTLKFTDGKNVPGVFLHLTVEDSEVEGLAVERIFVSENKLADAVVPEVGDNVDIRFNRFGKVQSCTVLK